MGAQGGNAGAVWIDLLVKNTIGRQIEKLSAQAGAQAERRFHEVGAKAGEAFDQSFAKNAQTVEKQVASIGEKAGQSLDQAFDRSVELAKCNLSRLEEQFDAVGAKMDAMRQEKLQNYSNSMMGKKAGAEAAEQALAKDKTFQKLEAQQERLNQQMQAARDRLRIAVEAAADKQAKAETRMAEKAAQAAERAGNRQEAAAKRAADEAQRAQERAAEASRRAHERAAQRVQNAWKKASGLVKRVQSGAAAAVKKSWGKATGGITKMFHTIGRTMRRVFVLGALLTFFHGLKDAMASAIKQNAQLSQSLAQVRGNLSNAFATVFSAVLPALQAMMNGLATITAKIASFLAALFGTTVSKSQAAANKLQSVGKGAAGASKKLEGALASWDELNVLQKEDASGGGGGGAGSSVTPPALSDDAAFSFGEQLRQAIQASDWDGLGRILGDKFNQMVTKLDFAGMGTKLGNGIQAAIQTAHSFIETVDWDHLGESIADGFNHVLERVDAYQLGAVLTSKWTIALGTLNGFVQTLDWTLLGQSLSNGIRGAFDNMTQAVVSFDWAGLGHRIMEFLTAIDWAGIFESVARFAGSCVGGALSTLWAMATDAWNGLWGYFEEKIQEAGGNVWAGFLHGIVDAVLGIGTWIHDHIFQPFWDGICAAFQIHSPSRKMMEIGRYIIEGMLDGIKNRWTRITSFFSRALADVKKVFSDAWSALQKNTAQMWKGIGNTIKAAVNQIIGIVNRMISAVTGGINAAVDAMNRIHLDIPGWVPYWGGKSFGLNIPHVGTPQIPMLAKGGVIQQPTLAMMGEYQGAAHNPEIAAPQSLLRETFAESVTPLVEAIGELIEYLKDDAEREIVLNLVCQGNMAQLIRVMKPYLEREGRRVGVKLVTGGEI